MERKITHYVVKPEHMGHFWAFCNKESLSGIVKVGSQELVMLTEAKVLDLWCTAVYEKPRVTGWFVLDQRVHGRIFFTMTGPHEVKQVGDYEQIFIDQEIE